MIGMATFGIGLLVAGAVAVFAGRPFHFYRPLLLVGRILYFANLMLLPPFLARYRVTEVMQKAGLQPNDWSGRAVEVQTAATDKAWDREGPLYRMCGVLLRAHLAIGIPIPLIGLALLLGSEGNLWIPLTAIGACLSVCAGALWVERMRRRHKGSAGPAAGSRCLAAEEVRQS